MQAIRMQKIRSATAQLPDNLEVLQKAVAAVKFKKSEDAKIDVNPDNFIIPSEMMSMLRLSYGYDDQLIIQCPQGHYFQARQAGVSQLAVTYCNVCLEDLKNKTQLQDMGEPSLCQMCGYTICSTCLLKREWINSLFPPMGRAWMRLFIEGLENQGHVLVFERFQQLWLGQIFRHCRKQLLTKRQLLLIGGSRMTAKLMGRCVWLRECVDSLARRCLGEPESEQLLNSRGDSVEMVEQGGSSSSTARRVSGRSSFCSLTLTLPWRRSTSFTTSRVVLTRASAARPSPPQSAGSCGGCSN
ncbi:unnamed protein product [Effrenium voratum]|uniref:Uncharacterized protein n=1 Tax=Effrenium voratum TaxID=2562239 RepID=A0AA36JGS3_9DINO|nr:unnamed protein product [Effrenium voratum]CAJ1460309.1 unnamed protein product [Effrenium voratum]